MSNSSLNNFEIFTGKVAAVKSSLGIETYVADTTLDLPKIDCNAFVQGKLLAHNHIHLHQKSDTMSN